MVAMGRRILLVDDDPALARAFSRLLRRRSYDVDVCNSAEAALASLAATTFDLVITDFRMSGLDGVAFAARVHRDLPRTPVILISGSMYGDDIERARAAGVVATLIKPITPSFLLDVVDRWAHRRPARAESPAPH
jgi:CheY-like chemotaxis protein